MKELRFEDLTTDQKLGMVMAGIVRHINCEDQYETFEENVDFILELIKNHSLGAVWVLPQTKGREEVMRKIKETADYPILIFTDAENGFGDYTIGRHNALGIVGTEEAAYTFGKVTALAAKKLGYNVICDPVLDMIKEWHPSTIRSLGSDKYKVAKLAIAEVKGIHDAGLLAVAKHYPGPKPPMDTHMAPGCIETTKEELIDYYLYPYLELMKEGLLDGIMTTHGKLKNIDPEFPTTISKKSIDIIRDLGFDGFAITDALDMMGLKAIYGDSEVKGMCIEAGNEIVLPWFSAVRAYSDLKSCYEKGIISDERLDEAVKRVLAAQHKLFVSNPKFDDITEEDIEKFESINKDSVYTYLDEGVETAISRDGKHFFVVLAQNETDIADHGKVSVDTFTNSWYKPERIIKKLESLFPNSRVCAISQFPTPNQNMNVLQDSLGYDDVIFITFTEAPAYAGSDHLTHRLVALINAMQMTNRISTIVHFGNPYVLEELSHISRVIVGTVSTKNIDAALDVLAGEYPAKGVPTYNIDLK